MNKFQKLALFTTLLATFVSLGAALVLLTSPENKAFPQEQFSNVVDQQANQKKLIANFKKNEISIKEKVDEHAKLIEEQRQALSKLNTRVTGVEKSQEEMVAIIEAQDKKINGKAPTTPITKPTTPTTPTKPATTTSVSGSVTVKEPTGLYLRGQASTASTAIALIPNNTRLTVIGGPTTSGSYTWLKIKTPSGKIGWIAREYTK